jgi:hypothetical protein
MTWIGACIVAALLLGALIGSVFSRERQDSERDQSHADKLDYPTDTNHKTSIAALARAHVALAKDADSAEKYQSTYNKSSYRVSLWTAIGVSIYTVFTAVIVGFSIAQYGETHHFNKRQVRFFRDQLEVMRGQVDLARSELELAQRPWLSVKPVGFISPLIFGEQGAVSALKIKVVNVGHSPAFHVWFDSETITDKPGFDMAGEQKRFCDARRAKPIGADGVGYSLFPNDDIGQVLGITILQADIDEALRMSPTVNSKAGFVAYVIGCVDYTFPFAAEHHQTAFAYEIDKNTGPSDFDFAPLDPRDKQIAASDMRVMVNPLVSGNTD